MSVLPEIPEAVKEKASDILLNMVNVTIQTMNDVVAFGKQQIPEVIHQLLMWKAVESFIPFAVNVILMVIGILLMTRWGKKVGNAISAKRDKAEQDYKDGKSWTRLERGYSTTSIFYDFFMATSSFVRLVLVVVGFILLLNAAQTALHSLEWLKILVAPKVYLIEYAAELIKQAK